MMTQNMTVSEGDIHINGKLAWRNPDRSGVLRNVDILHSGNNLFVNGVS